MAVFNFIKNFEEFFMKGRKICIRTSRKNPKKISNINVTKKSYNNYSFKNKNYSKHKKQ